MFKISLILLVSFCNADIKFAFDKDITKECNGNRKHTTGDCLKCPAGYIADPLKKTCIISINHFGPSLAWGDHCIRRSGLAEGSFGSHINEFGRGTLPNPLATDFVLYKFHCYKGALPNIVTGLSAVITNNTTLAETALTTMNFIDPKDALSCRELAPAGVPITSGSGKPADGTTELACELGFFYVIFKTVTIASQGGFRIKLSMTDSNTSHTMAD